jgi:hypothetical protein
MNRSAWVYVVLAVAFVAFTAIAYVLPTGTILAGVAGNVGVVALVCALFQLLRDQAAHEKEVWLRRDDQQFHVGVTSHMANTVFDKHVVFCEEYMAEVNATVDTLVREYATRAAVDHANSLFHIRRRHATWVTTSMSQRLSGFEDAVRSVGARAHFAEEVRENPAYAEQRTAAMKAVRGDFERILPHLFKKADETDETDEAEDGIASETVVQRVRDILDIERLVELRTGLIGRAHASLPS